MSGIRPTPDAMPEGWPLPEFHPEGHLNFLHIGKCAGTSVRLLVQSCHPAAECFQHMQGKHSYLTPREFIDLFQRHPVGKFSCSHVGSTIFELGAAPLNVFTWLRDPVETAFSIIYFVAQQAAISVEKRGGNFGIIEGIVASSKDPFEVFLKVRELFANRAANDFHPFHPLRPLTYLLAQPAGRRDLSDSEAVRSAIDTLRKCFFIGLLEEQQTSLEMLSRFLPLRCPARSFRANPTLVRPDTRRDLTPGQADEIRAIFAGEYEVYNEGKRLWNLQREALQAEGWLDLPAEARAAHAFRRLHPGLVDRGQWTADAPAFAEGFNEMEFDDAPVPGERVFWRWTSPGDRAAIRLPVRPGQTIRLAVEISKITPPPQLKAIAIEAGGERLPLRFMGRSENGFLFEGILNKDRIPEDGVDIGILNAKPFRGSASDPRQLGVAVLSIAWEPLLSRDRAIGGQA